ncbi:MAG: Rpn family recombination-promoting nuclease/putative transposase [Microscillaceae bacterium]|jgi:hypothetical protein|nr:Rpn family recombination-promoting nuclease/putative transposase [Microscillaceae bacterium]
MAKYINPYTDFGFKKLFGEGNKDLLMGAFQIYAFLLPHPALSEGEGDG